MSLELTDEQLAALIKAVDSFIDHDWYFLTPQRLRLLNEIRRTLGPQPPQPLFKAVSRVAI